jgi:hypothetical protein
MGSQLDDDAGLVDEQSSRLSRTQRFSADDKPKGAYRNTDAELREFSDPTPSCKIECLLGS